MRRCQYVYCHYDNMASAAWTGPTGPFTRPWPRPWRATSQSGRLSAGDRLAAAARAGRGAGRDRADRDARLFAGRTARAWSAARSAAARLSGPPSPPTPTRALVDLSINALPPHAHLGEIAARLDLPADAARRAALLNYPPHEGRDEPSRRRRRLDRASRRRRRALAGRWSPPAPSTRSSPRLSGQLGPGDTLLVEELTYAGLLEAVRLLGIVPVAVSHGRRRRCGPTRSTASRRQTGARTLALQPVLHNPTGVSMPPARRRAIAEVVARRGLHVIEDDIYGMLAPEAPPLVTELSSPWTYVTSLSKSVVAGVRVGFLAAQRRAVAARARARSGRRRWRPRPSPPRSPARSSPTAPPTASSRGSARRCAPGSSWRARSCRACRRRFIRRARTCGGRCRDPGVRATSSAPREAAASCSAPPRAFSASPAPRLAPCVCAWAAGHPRAAAAGARDPCAISRRPRRQRAALV